MHNFVLQTKAAGETLDVIITKEAKNLGTDAPEQPSLYIWLKNVSLRKPYYRGSLKIPSFDCIIITHESNSDFWDTLSKPK